MAKKTYGDVHAYRQLLSTHMNERVQCHVSEMYQPLSLVYTHQASPTSKMVKRHHFLVM